MPWRLPREVVVGYLRVRLYQSLVPIQEGLREDQERRQGVDAANKAPTRPTVPCITHLFYS